MTCCGAVPMTPVSCYTVFFGQWFPSFWAHSLCSWRYVLAPWLFELRPSRRGSAPMRSAKTCLPCHLTAAAARPETHSRQTLTPSCHRPQGPCRCLRSQCGAEIGNIRASRKMFLQHEITKNANEPVGEVDLMAKDATNNPLLSGLVGMIRMFEWGEDEGTSTVAYRFQQEDYTKLQTFSWF